MKNRVLLVPLLGAIALSLIGTAVFNLGQNSTMNPTTTSSSAKEALPSETTLETVAIHDIPNRPTGQRLTVNGTEIYYEVFGKGEPVLLLHGGAATIESWFNQIPELSKSYMVIAPDSRGHGRSKDAAGVINFELMAADMEALLDHLRVSNVKILGWSDGGVTGMEMAVRRPDLVGKLATLGAHSRPEGMTEEFRHEVESSRADVFPDILVDGYKALSPDGPEHWPVVFNKLKTMWLTLPNFEEDELKQVQCPVLLLVGEHDIVRIEESERLSRLIPKARLEVIKGASHYSPVEVPDLVNEKVMRFFGES